MKILIVGHSLHGGGAEFVTRTWVNSLLCSGHKVGVAVLDQRASDEWLPAGAGYHHVDGGGSHARRVRELSSLLAEGNYDVCLAMQTYPSLVSILAVKISRSRRTAVVLSERNIPSVLLRNEGFSQKVQRFLARLLYPRADGAVAISHPVAADLVSFFNIRPDRVFVVPNPAYDVSILDQRHSRDEVATAISLVLPFRLADQKQPLRALEVAAELKSRGHSVMCVAFGIGPLLEAVVERAAAMNVDVDFRGWQEEWTGECPSGSIVLLPSQCEGFGNVLVEAATAGIPSVAASSALGVADAIVPGLTGQLALSDSVEALSDAVEECVGMKVDASMWLARFSPENSARLLAQALQTVVRNSRRVRVVVEDGH